MIEGNSERFLAHSGSQKPASLPVWILMAYFLAASLVRAEGRLLNVRVSSEDGSTPVVDIAMRTSAGEQRTLQEALQVPWQGTLRVPEDRTGTIMIISDGYWSRSIPTTETDGDLHFRLFPAGTLTGRISFGDSEVFESGELDFKMLPRDQSGLEQEVLTSGRVECTIAKAALKCSVPEGMLDARLAIGDYAPEFFWNVAAKRDTDSWLGVRKLVRGPSIAGWTESPSGFSKSQSLKVKAAPQEYAVSLSGSARERTDLLGRTVEVSDRGFFQMKGMRPGEYEIHAFGEGLVSDSQKVLVDERSEAIFLEHPLVLTPPSRLEIFVDPLVDPWGGAWRVDISQQEGLSNTYAMVNSLEVSLSGFAEVGAISPGNYDLEVYDSRGSAWVSRAIAISQGSERIVLEISAVPIRGTVRIGDSGTAATLVFGTRSGGISIAVASDGDGNFEGVLPNEGEWPLEIEMDAGFGEQAAEPVTVRRKPGKTFAELQIELPDTTVKGKVLEDGLPTDAIVLAIRESDEQTARLDGRRRRRDITGRTDENGTFLVRGVSPGELKLVAYNRSKSSEWRTVVVEEGREGEDIVLELVQKIELAGRLFRGQAAVSGARVIAFPNEGLALETVSAPDGSFDLKAPGNAKWVDFAVLPPGAPILFHRKLLGDRNVQRVDLSVPLESMDLVVSDFSRFGYLYSQGISVSLDTVMNTLLPAGRVEAALEGGLVLRGVAPGEWSLCPGPVYSDTDCVVALSSQEGTQPVFEPNNEPLGESER